MNARLHYVHDPMCSWCWAFRPVLDALRGSLPPTVPLVHVLGGLAPDTDVPMPPDLRAALEGTWRRIEAHVPGTRFDYRFWREATPRRATFRACRAVIAVRRQDPTLERAMIDAIQRAYYLEARNPSDRDVLIDLADGLGADAARVAEELDGEAVRAAHEEERRHAAALGVQGYPSLVLVTDEGGRDAPRHAHPVPIDYTDPAPILARVAALTSATAPLA